MFLIAVGITSTASAFTLLGDAYIRILNPELAVDAFESAYKLDNSNVHLRGRIGTYARQCVCIITIVICSLYVI